MKRNRAFTLIEILVTIFIIATITMIAVPNFSQYREMTYFNNKATEIESLYYYMYELARNPQRNDVSNYSVIFNSPNFILTESLKDGTSLEVRRVKLEDSRLTVIQGNNGSEVYCYPPGNVCHAGLNNLTLVGSSPIQLYTLTDNNFSPGRNKKISIRMNPFTLTINDL